MKNLIMTTTSYFKKYGLFLLMALGLSACSKNETAQAEINFKATSQLLEGSWVFLSYKSDSAEKVDLGDVYILTCEEAKQGEGVYHFYQHHDSETASYDGYYCLGKGGDRLTLKGEGIFDNDYELNFLSDNAILLEGNGLRIEAERK